MNIKAWIAVGIAGFAIGAGTNGLQIALSDDGSAPPSNAQAGNDAENQFPGGLGSEEFAVPGEGEFELPEGPITLRDGSVIEITEDGGQITLPDGTVIDAPDRPGFRERFGGQAR